MEMKLEHFGGIVYELDMALLTLRYDYVIEVFHQISSSWEDNVGAELIDKTSIDRLKLYASSSLGHKMLNILYEAIITGDVSEFERKQANKILEVTQISQKSYVAQAQSQLLTFPVKNQGFTRDCYATFRAELQPNGNVKVWYNSVRIWECAEFKQDVATFPNDPTNPRELAPQTLVNVHLYDQGGAMIPIPAIALIDYANQSKNKTLNLAETAFVTGLTIGAGGFGGTAGGAAADGTAWGARAVAGAAKYGQVVETAAALAARAAPYAARVAWWADRIAIVLPVLSDIIEDNRDWIIENVPFGNQIVFGIEKANAIIAYYGFARLGIDGLRFAAGQVRGVLKVRANGSPASLNAEQKALLEKIDTNSQELLSHLEQTEQAILENQAAQQAALAPDAAAGGNANASAPQPAPASPAVKSHEPPPAKQPPPKPEPHPAAHDHPAQPQPPVKQEPPPAHASKPADASKPDQHTSAPVSKASQAAVASAEKNRIIDAAIGKKQFGGDFSNLANQELSAVAQNPGRVRPSHMEGYNLEVPIEGTDHFLARKKSGGWCLFSGSPNGCGAITVAKTVDDLFAEIGRELGLDKLTTRIGNSAKVDIAKAVHDAKDAGFVGAAGEPVGVDLVVQAHRDASDTRAAIGVSGHDVQSAHHAPSSAVKGVAGYNREDALTVLLPRATHKAFDDTWKEWSIAQRHAGKTQATIAEFLRVVDGAIEKTPDILPRTKDAMSTVLFNEFYRDLALKPDDLIDLPYPNIKPEN
jgi:hypothetical protein